MAYYKKHLFFCVNQKGDGKKCCASGDAEAMFCYAKKRLKEADQHGPDKVRVSKSGCLGRCSSGPCLLVYPEQTWYSYRDSDDIDAIIDQDILGGEVVDSLLITQE